MPYCQKCCKKLTKNKNQGYYHCTKHGYARDIGAPDGAHMISDIEFFSRVAAGKVKVNKPSHTKPQPQKYKLSLKAFLNTSE